MADIIRKSSKDSQQNKAKIKVIRNERKGLVVWEEIPESERDRKQYQRDDERPRPHLCKYAHCVNREVCAPPR
jgi:hypothetical protein